MTRSSFVLLRRISIALTALGLLIAGYLTVIYLTNSSTLCNTGCDLVRQSRYARVGGVPVAAIGLAGYLAILVVFIAEEVKGPLAEQGPALAFGLTLTGTLYSIYLTYLELFVIRAVCPYCIASAIVMAATLGIAIARLSIALRI